MRKLVFAILSLMWLTGIAQESEPALCHLKGELIGRNSKAMLLIKWGEDPRAGKILIPIVDNHFEYILRTDTLECYTLFFQKEYSEGAWTIYPFFNEPGTVEIKIFPDHQREKTVAEGGVLNTKMAEFNAQQKKRSKPEIDPIYKQINQLQKSDLFMTEEMKRIIKVLKSNPTDEEETELYHQIEDMRKSRKGYTPEAQRLLWGLDSVRKSMVQWENKYIENNLDIYSYYLLFKQVPNNRYYDQYFDLEFILRIYPEFARRYPSHPYTKAIAVKLEALNVVVGVKYMDFTAQTLDGRDVCISQLIEGRVALIDLWGSWCGSCRAASRAAIPIYEKYKDRGFVVIGVAGERRDTNDLMIALKNDQYPWETLVELDGRNSIWAKYGISNSGGSTFLVDSKGIILAISPTAKELDAILNEQFKVSVDK